MSTGWLRRHVRARWLICVGLATGALTGCGTIPSFGPNVGEVLDESRMAQRYGFTLVNVDGDVLHAIAAAQPDTLRRLFPDDRAVVPRIGHGDVLSVTVYESGAGELFAPASSQQLTYGTDSVTLPAVTVDPAGNITVPFASTINVAGLTPMEVQTSSAGTSVPKASSRRCWCRSPRTRPTW